MLTNSGRKKVGACQSTRIGLRLRATKNGSVSTWSAASAFSVTTTAAAQPTAGSVILHHCTCCAGNLPVHVASTTTVLLPPAARPHSLALLSGTSALPSARADLATAAVHGLKLRFLVCLLRRAR